MIIHVDGSTTNKQFVYRKFNFRTRWCCGPLAAGLLRALLLAWCVNAAMGQGCEGRDFRCVDPTHYAVCLPRELRSKDWSADPEVSCPEGTFCDERSPARCSPQPQSGYSRLVRRVARSLDHMPEGGSGECPGAGRFPVAGSCSSLVVCVPGVGGLRARRTSCPPGAAFDRVSRRCVARRLLPRDPRNAACLSEEKQESGVRRKRSAVQPSALEVAQEALQKRVPQPQPQQQPAARSLAAAIYVAPNVTEISPAGPYGRCREGETWDASLGQCMLTDERSIGPAFHCDGRGVFPDRGNPNAYISCDPLVTGEGFVAHRYWCPITMQFDPISRVCRTHRLMAQRSSVKSRRRTNSLPRPEDGSSNDGASNPSDDAVEGDWSQVEETEEKVRSQRQLYRPESSQSSDTDNESFNDVNGDAQIERSESGQITDALRNPKEVPDHGLEKRVAKNSLDDWTKMVSHEETNVDSENVKDVLKRDDSDIQENHQLIPGVDNSGGSEEDNIAGDVKSADPERNRIAFNQGYFSVNNEEQGFQGDSEQADPAFEIQNEAQQHEQVKRVAENAVEGSANKVSSVETNSDSTGAKNVLKRDELEQNHRLTSSEDTGENKDADRLTGGQILSEPVRNMFTNNVGYADMNSDELSFSSDSDQPSAAFQSQNAAENQRQMTDLGDSSIADLTNKISPLESDSALEGSLDILKRGEVEQNQLDSNAYSVEGGEEDGLQGNAGVEDIEKAAGSEFGQVRVDSRDLRQTQSHEQMKIGEEKSIADWSNEAGDGSTVEKKLLKRDEVEHGHQQVSSSDISEDNEVDELEGYVDTSNNGQAVGDSEELSVASQNENEAQDSNQMKRVAKSSSVVWPNKDEAFVDSKEVLKRDDGESSQQMFSRADISGDDPVVGEDELSDSAELDEGLVYDQPQESLPRYHSLGRRDNDAEISGESGSAKGEVQEPWNKEELVEKKDTPIATGSGGDSRRSLSLPGDGLRPSEEVKSAEDVNQNESEQKSNDIGASAEAPGQFYEGDHLSKGSSNEHSKFVEREASSRSDQKISSSDAKSNTGGSPQPHDNFLEQQDEILRQLSSMKERSAVNKARDDVEASRDRQERSESSRDKQGHHQGNRHIILLKPHEDNTPVGDRVNEQVNSPNSGNLALSASLEDTARSPQQLSGDKAQAEKQPAAVHSKERSSARKEKLSVTRRQHSEKESKEHSKREETHETINSGVEKRESRPSSRNAETVDSDKPKKQPKMVREGQHKNEPVLNIDQIIKDAERLARIKATPRKPVTEYLEKEKRHARGRAVAQTSASDPKTAGKNERKDNRGKSSREAAGTKQVGTLNPAPRVAAKSDKRGDAKVSGKVTREVMESKQTNDLRSGGFERDDRRQNNEGIAKDSYENNRKSSGNSLTPVIEEIISNSVNKYSKFPPVSLQEKEKAGGNSAIKDREVVHSMRRTNEYEEDPNVALQGKSGPTHDTPKTEKKGMSRDTKKHAGHRATSSKESGFYQSGYISMGAMNKLARFQRNGRNVIYDVTSLSDNKISDEMEHDAPYAASSRRRAMDSTREGGEAAVPEDVIGVRTLLSTKHSDNEPEAKDASSTSLRSEKEITDRKERKDSKTQIDKQVKEESRDVASAKTDVAGHLRSLSSFDDNSNKLVEGPLQKAENSDKGASKRTLSGEQDASYEKVPENSPGAVETRSSRRVDDSRRDTDGSLLNALRKSISDTPFKDPVGSPATAFECPGGGSYPYREDDRAYYACVPNADGSGFVATIRSCSENEVFDPITRSCTPRDIMPSREYKSSQLQQSASIMARSAGDEPLENPCTAEGRISNPYDCSAFYLCLPKRPGISSGPDFFHIALRCPKGSIFDTESRQCVEGSPATCIPEYKLLDKLRRRRGRLRSQSPSQAQPQPQPGPASPRASRSPQPQQQREACPRPGRFARAGGGCADYVLCARPGGVGPLLAVPVRCPAGLAFSAERARCVSPDVAGCQPGP